MHEYTVTVWLETEWQAEKLSASQKGLCSMVFVLFVSQQIGWLVGWLAGQSVGQ